MNTVDRKYLRLTLGHATDCMTMSPLLFFCVFGACLFVEIFFDWLRFLNSFGGFVCVCAK